MSNSGVIRDCRAMIAGMSPVVKQGAWFFCTTTDKALADALAGKCLASFREDEGTAMVLERTDAEAYGFDLSMPMSRIVLEVHSALDGVGLTAAVASALAEGGIPCNMIAAYHHDNVFVPEAMSQRALEILAEVQRQAAAGAA